MALRHQLRDGEEGPPHVVKKLKRWARRKDKRTLKRAAEPPMEQQPAPKRAAGVRSQAAAAQERKQLRREEQQLRPQRAALAALCVATATESPAPPAAPVQVATPIAAGTRARHSAPLAPLVLADGTNAEEREWVAARKAASAQLAAEELAAQLATEELLWREEMGCWSVSGKGLPRIGKRLKHLHIGQTVRRSSPCPCASVPSSCVLSHGSCAALPHVAVVPGAGAVHRD